MATGKGFAATAAAVCFALAAGGARAQELESTTPDGRKTVRIVRTATPPVIDGKLDDAVWQQAGLITSLHQIRPGDGTPPSEPTEVYLLYDDDNFYIGARMHDSDPSLIVAPTFRHGQGLGPDDRLVVIFDPFNTGRSGYRFETNANGVRHDALYTNVSSFQQDWTVIWETEATIDETGWVAEMAIPFKSLPFDPSIDTWGFNFGRGIRRRGEEMAWVSRNRTYNPSILGQVTGLEGMDQGLGLDVVPSMAVSRKKAFVTGATSSDTEPSLDVFYRFTPSLNGSLTINTDFSATEVDTRQVNLTRFNLFFPEKRDFFLAQDRPCRHRHACRHRLRWQAERSRWPLQHRLARDPSRRVRCGGPARLRRSKGPFRRSRDCERARRVGHRPRHDGWRPGIEWR